MKDGDVGGYLLGVEKMNNGDDDAISVKRKTREQMVLELHERRMVDGKVSRPKVKKERRVCV